VGAWAASPMTIMRPACQTGKCTREWVGLARMMSAGSLACTSPTAGHVGEPPHFPARCQRVAEERPFAEDHGVAPRFGIHRHAAGVAAEVDQADVGGCGRGGVDEPAGHRADAVGTDQHLPTPVRAPRANAFAERWVGTVRRELLDRMLILGRRQLETVLAGYVAHDNEHRPHRALGQASPLTAVPPTAPTGDVRVVRADRLGRLIHEYAQVA
jgi:Integrase core domain